MRGRGLQSGLQIGWGVRPALALLCLGACLATTGCSDAAPGTTSVVVFVYSELAPGRDLDALTVDVTELGGSTRRTPPTRFELAETNATGDATLPLSFGIVPADNDSAPPFELVVTGWLSDEAVVRQVVRARFTRHEKTALSVFLLERCQAMCLTDPSQSCNPVTGACGAPPELRELPAAVNAVGVVPEQPNPCEVYPKLCDEAGDGGAGDGDGTTGDGHGTTGDGDGTSGDGDGTVGDGDGSVGDGGDTVGDGDGDVTAGDGDGTVGDGDGMVADGDAGVGAMMDAGPGDGGLPDCEANWEQLPTSPVPNPTGSLTLTPDRRWQLGNSPTHVEAGSTLTIEPCTRVEGTAADSALVVDRGARLVARGSADRPIVFTSSLARGARAAGDWGGVILLGRAPNFAGSDLSIASITSDPRIFFGGSEPDDDSGVLSYVRIEYAGAPLWGGDVENGLSIGSVGRATVLDHVMVHRCEGDCFEFFGGTVSGSQLVCDDPGDDMFDIDVGYQGSLSQLFGRQLSARAGESSGIDADGDPNGGSPATDFTVQEATFCGQPGSGMATYGLLLRENVLGAFDQIALTGFDYAVDAHDMFGTSAAPNVTLAHSTFFALTSAGVAPDESLPADNDDFGFDEEAWFAGGTGNAHLGTGPFTPNDCRAPAPTAAVTGSGIGAFKTDAFWLEGAWINWDPR